VHRDVVGASGAAGVLSGVVGGNAAAAAAAATHDDAAAGGGLVGRSARVRVRVPHAGGRGRARVCPSRVRAG